ncbi:MAG: hypothetical protein H7177_05900 [Rhizobacter sp.]|nr:hypothetical protein [Bacteriovorax sp.]
MKNRFNSLKERIKKTKSELGALGTFSHDYLINNSVIGIGQPVVFDINIIFARHEYHLNRFLYHTDKFIEILENYKFPWDDTSHNNQESILTGWNDERIYYEFDAFITTASTLFEDPFKQDAQKVFTKPLYKKFESIFPDKSTADSIVWRLTIIRNRVVHPDHAAYNSDGNRLAEFSSKFSNLAEIKDGFPIRINGHLVDIDNSEELKHILQKEVIDKSKDVKKNFNSRGCEFDCAPSLPDFHRIVFMQSKSKKKDANMVITKEINLIESFLSIANLIINYTNQLHQIFYLANRDKMNENFPKDRGFLINKDGRVYGWGLESRDSDSEFKSQSELFGNI